MVERGQARPVADADRYGNPALARAAKLREGDHFQAAVGLRSQLEDFRPPIPEWCYDQHTIRGKAQGRGVDYFRKVSTKLVPAPKKPDDYESEAYRLWEVKASSDTTASKGKPQSDEKQLF